VDKKTYTAAAAVKDADEGTVQAEFATLDVVDLDGDVTLAGAFGNQAVKLAAWGHDWGNLPVGKGGISEQETKAVFDGQFFLDTTSGQEHFKTVRNLGDLQEWSYGFEVLKAVRKGDPAFDDLLEASGLEAVEASKVWRFLKKMRVFEVSPVMRAAGIDTRTTDIKDAKDRPWRELKLNEHADFLIEEAQAFVDRSQSVTEELDEEGRLLSGSKRDRLQAMGKALESVRDEIAALLKRTEHPTSERLLGLYEDARRIEERINRLGG
jgi:hypothetical protein